MTRWGWSTSTILVILAIAVVVIGIVTLFLPLPSSTSMLGIAGVLIASLIFSLTLYGKARSIEHQRANEVEALVLVNRAVNSSVNPEERLASALDAILECTHAAAGRIWLIDRDTSRLRFRLHRGLFPETFSQPIETPFGSTAAGKAAVSGETVLVKVAGDLPEILAKGFVSLVSIPLQSRKQVIGVLEVASRHPGELTESTVGLLQRVGTILGLTIENDALMARLSAREEQERLWWKSGLDIAAAQDYDSLLTTLADRSSQVLGADASAVCIWDEQKHWWTIKGISGAADAYDVSVKRTPAPCAGEHAECPIVRSKYQRDHVKVPLEYSGRALGCLCIAGRRARDLSAEERSFIEGISNHASIALDRAKRFDEEGQRAATIERERLAREMHDTLAQLLGFVNVKTLAAREHLAQNQLEQARLQLDQLSALAQELYADTRELILGLRTEATTEKSLVAALTEYVERFSQFSEIETSCSADGLEGERFPPTVEVQLIRVVQEALSNVRKHSRAHHASVSFRRTEENACICVEDDGEGFDPGKLSRGWWPRFGLQSMRERVEAIGGRFSICSVPGKGTTIALQVPLVYRSAAGISAAKVECKED